MYVHGLSLSVMSNSLRPHGLQSARTSVHGDSPGKNPGVGCHPPPGDLPNPGIKPRSPALQADSLPFEPPGKPSKGYILGINVYIYVYYTAMTDYLHLSGRLDIIELGMECDRFLHIENVKCMELSWKSSG